MMDIKLVLCCHSHATPHHCMMHCIFSLQIYEAQISSMLHHLMHDVDVSLPDMNQKYNLLVRRTKCRAETDDEVTVT